MIVTIALLDDEVPMSPNLAAAAYRPNATTPPMIPATMWSLLISIKDINYGLN